MAIILYQVWLYSSRIYVQFTCQNNSKKIVDSETFSGKAKHGLFTYHTFNNLKTILKFWKGFSVQTNHHVHCTSWHDGVKPIYWLKSFECILNLRKNKWMLCYEFDYKLDWLHLSNRRRKWYWKCKIPLHFLRWPEVFLEKMIRAFVLRCLVMHLAL